MPFPNSNGILAIWLTTGCVGRAATTKLIKPKHLIKRRVPVTAGIRFYLVSSRRNQHLNPQAEGVLPDKKLNKLRLTVS